MKIILDTNVFLSGIFFAGPPYEILNAWRHGLITLIVSPAILGEYERVGQELQKEYPTIEFSPFLELLTIHGEMVEAPPLPERVCTDADDDMFLACALACGAKIVISGDKALRKTSGYHGIMVLSAREYMEKYLKKGASLPVEKK
jgi:uncharacterized protein